MRGNARKATQLQARNCIRTKMRPKGIWMIGVRGSTPRQHLVRSAQALWSGGEFCGHVARTECGVRLDRPWISLEPREDVQLCDSCLLADSQRESVYHAIGSTGESVYIGYSSHLYERLTQHRRCSAWWPRVARWEFTYYATEADALVAERVLIAEYLPEFNVQFTPRAPRPGPKAKAVVA